MTAQQFRKLDRTVADKDPEQRQFPFALWSFPAVVCYLQRTFGVTICQRTARRYFRKLGYAYQCPPGEPANKISWTSPPGRPSPTSASG